MIPPPLRLLAILPLSLLIGSAQNSDKRFEGTWQASYKNEVICTIRLRVSEKLSGNMGPCHIHVNNDGEIDQAGESEGGDPQPIQNLKVSGDKLSFEVDDGSDVTEFEMELTGSGVAALRLTNAPVKIKPIRFEKVQGKSTGDEPKRRTILV